MDSTGLETEGVPLILLGVRNALQEPLEVEIGGEFLDIPQTEIKSGV